MTSKRFRLDSIDFKKIGIGLGVAVLGALATYLEELIPSVNFQEYTAIAVAINSVIVNAIRKFITDYSLKETKKKK